MVLPSLPSDLSVINGVTTRYTYDAAGRLVREGSKTYRYGYLDKVMSVTDNGSTYTYEGVTGSDLSATVDCHTNGRP